MICILLNIFLGMLIGLFFPLFIYYISVLSDLDFGDYKTKKQFLKDLIPFWGFFRKRNDIFKNLE